MRRSIIVALTLAAVAACNEPPQNLPGGPDTGLALATSRRAKDSLILVKDSLLAVKERQLSLQSQLIGDAATSARLVSEIDRALSAARIRVKEDTLTPESGMRNATQELQMVQKKVTAVIARLNASEARLRQMRQDSTLHASFDSTQAVQIREYAQSIADLRMSVENQRQEIAILTARVDSMGRANVVLAARNDTAMSRIAAMAAFEDSVYVAIGTEKELAAQGVVRREGGTLLMFGRGKTLVPGRSPAPGSFRALSKTRDLSIALPNADKDYRVISRQGLEYTDAAKPKDAIVRGTLTITDPMKFWAPSKYLILVQK